MSALRDNQVAESFAWFDVLEVHGFEHFLVAVDYHLGCTSTLNAVAAYNANKTVVGICINKNFDVHQVANTFVRHNKNAFEYHHVVWPHMDSLLLTRACDVVVGGHIDCSTLFQVVEMSKQKVPIECCRLVEIDFLTVLQRHMARIFIIIILWDYTHLTCRKVFHNFSYYCSLAWACTSGYSNDKHCLCYLFC